MGGYKDYLEKKRLAEGNQPINTSYNNDFIKQMMAINQEYEGLRQQQNVAEDQQGLQMDFAKDVMEKTPLPKFLQAGMDFSKGNIGEGLATGTQGLIQTAMVPFTIPFSAVTEGLRKTGEVGGEVATGLERTMNLPFDAIKYGSEAVNEAVKLAGIDLSLGDKELDKKLNELAQEVGGLYLMGKTHRSIRNYIDKKLPEIKIVKGQNIQKPFKIEENQPLPVEGLTQEKLPIEQIKNEVKPVEQPIAPTVEKQPLTQTETPVEGKVTKPAKDINRKIVEQGFDELPPEELAQYNPVTKKALLDKINGIMSDPEKAKTQLFDKSNELTPRERQVLWNAIKNKANSEGDIPLIKKVAANSIATERSEAAGTLGASGFNNWTGEADPVKAVQEVIKTREESPSGQRRQIVEEGYNEKIKSLEEQINKQNERLKQLETERAYKRAQREVRKEQRTVTKEQLSSERSDLYTKLYKVTGNLNVGNPISPEAIKILGQLLKNYAQEGITNAAEIIDAIHATISDKINISKEDIRDALSGYGKETVKTRDDLQKRIADLRSQMLTIAKIEDLESGTLPHKRTVEKTKPSEELQKLKDELKTKLKESDIVAEENLGKTKENIRNKIKELNNKIEKGDYEEVPKREKMTDDERIKLEKDLKETRDKFNDIQKNLGDKISDEEVKIISELSKATNDAKIKMESSPRREFGENPTETELAYGHARVAYAEYVDGLKEQANKMTWEEFKKSPLMNLLKGAGHIPGMTKSLKATFDNSGLFNQNILTLYTHPTIWARNGLKSFQDIWNTLGGKNVMAEINADKVSRLNYTNGLYHKLKLAIGTVEEAFPDSKVLEKVPVLGKIHKAANTAFTGLAYRNRMDIADLLIKHAENTGIDPFSAEFNGVGKVINSLTGRASLGRFEGGGDLLNVAMFAPRFLKSHVDVLLGHIYSKEMGRFARIEALKNLIKIVGGMSATTLAINAVKPGTVEVDPRSTDFAKVKIGDTRFNYTGGLGSIITLSSRLLPLLAGMEGKTKNSKGELVELNSGKFGARTGLDILKDFMQGKSSPVLGLILDRLDGQTYTGQRLTAGNQLQNLVTPLPIQNVQETLQDPKSANLIATTIADALGLFATTYSNSPDLRTVQNALLIANKEKFSQEKLINLNKSLRKLLKGGDITLDQFNNYKEQIKELQLKAPKKTKSKGF